MMPALQALFLHLTPYCLSSDMMSLPPWDVLSSLLLSLFPLEDGAHAHRELLPTPLGVTVYRICHPDRAARSEQREEERVEGSLGKSGSRLFLLRLRGLLGHLRQRGKTFGVAHGHIRQDLA